MFRGGALHVEWFPSNFGRSSRAKMSSKKSPKKTTSKGKDIKLMLRPKSSVRSLSPKLSDFTERSGTELKSPAAG